jgi:hypothetical protein
MTIDRIPPAVAEVFAFMKKHRISPADLTEIGGEDLRSPRTRAKARDVESAWELMARLGLKYSDLESDPKKFL